MTRIKLRYYVVKKGKGFWQPTRVMRKVGFISVPCGVDGPEAWVIAEQWNLRWDKARRGEACSPAMASSSNLSPQKCEELTIYPVRSLGEAFRRYRLTEEWARKAARTREDWWRCWRHIKPIFGDVDPRSVTLEDISGWRKAIEDLISLREAHRCLKIWRAMWKVAAALGYCLRESDPSLGVRNTAARPRSASWIEGEAARLYKRAWREGFHGLAAVIAVAWSSQLSPGDVRSLRASQLRRDAHGAIFFSERAKTGKPVGGALSVRAITALDAYLDRMHVILHGEAFIFRNRSGQPYTKDSLGDDFREVRIAEFGASDGRTLADFRRSGAVEAIAGDATPAALAHAMGNTLSVSNALFATYVPVNRTTIHAVAEARRLGRRRLRENG